MCRFESSAYFWIVLFVACVVLGFVGCVDCVFVVLCVILLLLVFIFVQNSLCMLLGLPFF